MHTLTTLVPPTHPWRSCSYRYFPTIRYRIFGAATAFSSSTKIWLATNDEQDENAASPTETRLQPTITIDGDQAGRRIVLIIINMKIKPSIFCRSTTFCTKFSRIYVAHLHNMAMKVVLESRPTGKPNKPKSKLCHSF